QVPGMIGERPRPKQVAISGRTISRLGCMHRSVARRCRASKTKRQRDGATERTWLSPSLFLAFSRSALREHFLHHFAAIDDFDRPADAAHVLLVSVDCQGVAGCAKQI